MEDEQAANQTDNAKTNSFISYRTAQQGERLKPFLFWMIVSAAAMVVGAISSQFFGGPKFYIRF